MACCPFDLLLPRDTLILGISSSHLAHNALLPFASATVSGCPLKVSQSSQPEYKAVGWEAPLLSFCKNSYGIVVQIIRHIFLLYIESSIFPWYVQLVRPKGFEERWLGKSGGMGPIWFPPGAVPIERLGLGQGQGQVPLLHIA